MAHVSARKSKAKAAVAFGSCQERKMFPLQRPPNRLGREQLPPLGSRARGPGCHDNHVVDTMISKLERKPLSMKGYSLAARTTPRFFAPLQTNTPSPQQYQQDWSVPRVPSPGKTPFNSSSRRITSKSATVSSNPGPGTYAHDVAHSRKVSWPMKFGSPDWSRVPMLERRALHTE
ncbi:hypothetical protein P4O66_020826, partial [Electrophorus voltai]